jgi:hypothetical protein
MDLYIYYRVACAHEQEARTRIGSMQDRIAARHGIAGSLKRRPEPSDGRHTWMEVYPAVPENFLQLLDAAVDDAALGELIDGERHIEFFMDGHTCA